MKTMYFIKINERFYITTKHIEAAAFAAFYGAPIVSTKKTSLTFENVVNLF